MDLNPVLVLSALGIYLHAIYITLTFALPIAIAIVLWKYWRSGDMDYMDAAKKMAKILSVNFALGAVTGTLVEFGLVQIWSGFNLAIATFAFAPLALELIAFANEIAFLVLFMVTLGRVKPILSMVFILATAGFAYLSGALIMVVNSWMQAPWGTGTLPSTFYPFMPEYGPTEVDVGKLLLLKLVSLSTGKPIAALLQDPNTAERIGIVLKDPMIVFSNPYAWVSIAHNILAGILVGLSIIISGWIYRYFKTGDSKYLKIVKPIIGVFAMIFFVQAPIVAHFMGEAVVEYQPTKFALMEGAEKTYHNALIALIAYGDPNKPIIGFDRFEDACKSLGNITLGDIAKKYGIDIAIFAGEDSQLAKTLSMKLANICLADLREALKRMHLVHELYYAKVSFAIIGGLSAAAMFLAMYRVPVLSRVASVVTRLFGRDERRRVLVLAILMVLGTALPAILGWAVREIGRKP